MMVQVRGGVWGGARGDFVTVLGAERQTCFAGVNFCCVAVCMTHLT